MILDLSVFQEETLDIQMGNGHVLHVQKPSEAMVIHVLRFRQLNVEADEEKAMQLLGETVLRILNENTEGLKFKPEDVAKLPVKAKTAIVDAYARFILDIQKNPTSPFRRSPETPRQEGTKKSSARFGRWWNTRG